MDTTVLLILALTIVLLPTAAAGQFSDGFETPIARRWFTSDGKWQVRRGVLEATGPDSLRRWDNIRNAQLLTHFALRRGKIRLRAMARTGPDVWKNPKCKFNSFIRLGVILGLRDGEAGPAVVFDESVCRLESDGRSKTKLGPCRIVPNQWHDLEVAFDGSTVTARLDGKKIGSAPCRISSVAGTVGLITYGDAAFDDVRITGDVHSRYAPQPAGGAKLAEEFVEWRPARPDRKTGRTEQGSLHVYVRNTGSAPAILRNISLDKADKPGKTRITPRSAPPWVSYVRQNPHRIAPGQLGQVEIRMRGIPEAMAPAAKTRPKRGVPMELVILPTKGTGAWLTVNLWGATPAAARVNFLAFSEDLKTVYAYVQKTPGTARGKALRIAGAAVNGVSDGANVRVGRDSLAGGVVPIRIDLPKPLVAARPTVVTVRFANGLRIGHCLRAFPSRFLIGVDGWADARGARSKKDWDAIAADLHNHCVNTVGNIGVWNQWPQWRYHSLDNKLRHHLPYDRKKLIELWVDEVDKPWGRPIHKLLPPWVDAEAWYYAQGKQYPHFISWNVMNIPRTGVEEGYLNYPDAIRTSYGWYACPRVTSGKSFGRLSGLATSEYRLARRPMRPYLRDCETFIPLDERTKRSLPPTDMYQRCATPKEARWIQFGTLIWGAKSLTQCGYWSAAPRTRAWFNKTSFPLHIRAGLGGLAGRKEVFGYRIDKYYHDILNDVWDECGRINAELATVGPLIARSDVTRYARVVECTKQKAWKGGKSVEVAALVSGLDTIVLVVLNMSLDFRELKVPTAYGISAPRPPNFPPASATVALTLPTWLEDPRIFRISSAGVEAVRPAQRTGRKLIFKLPRVLVSDLIILTASDDVYQRCQTTLKTMQQRLRAAGISLNPTEKDPARPIPRAAQHK